jgi:hypothetical protein
MANGVGSDCNPVRPVTELNFVDLPLACHHGVCSIKEKDRFTRPLHMSHTGTVKLTTKLMTVPYSCQEIYAGESLL